MHDHADAPRDGQLVGNDPLARGRDVVPARGRQTAHRSHHRLAGLAFILRNRPVDLVGGKHLAPG